MEALSLFERPRLAAVPPAGRRPRDYQVAAVAGIREALGTHRSTIAVLATGLGKSYIAGRVAAEATGRVLALAHMDTLVSQLKASLEQDTGAHFELEQAENWAAPVGSGHVIASVQSLAKQRRLERFAPDAFSLVIVDEAHHYVSPAFRRPLEYFASAKVLCLTATPDRKDRKAMGRIAETVAYKMDLVDGINAGWLVPIVCRPPRVCRVDLDRVTVSKASGDFVAAELDAAMAEDIAPVVEACLSDAGDLRTLVFMPGVMSAHSVAQALNGRRPDCARAIDGGMDKAMVRRTLASYRRGEFQFLVNCAMLLEGFDDRGIQCIVDGAATKSRSRCTQKVGRGTRPAADVDDCADVAGRRAAIAASAKPGLVWIDLKYNSGKHQLACPLDLLAGSFTDKERASARRALEAKGGDPLAALEDARKRIAARANRAKVDLQLDSFDPTARKPLSTDVPSPRQLLQMRRFGMDPSEWPSLDRGMAQKLLNYEFMARSKGLCSYIQRRWLQEHLGIEGKGVSQARGKALAEYWRDHGKPRRLNERQYAEAIGRLPLLSYEAGR